MASAGSMQKCTTTTYNTWSQNFLEQMRATKDVAPAVSYMVNKVLPMTLPLPNSGYIATTSDKPDEIEVLGQTLLSWRADDPGKVSNLYVLDPAVQIKKSLRSEINRNIMNFHASASLLAGLVNLHLDEDVKARVNAASEWEKFVEHGDPYAMWEELKKSVGSSTGAMHVVNLFQQQLIMDKLSACKKRDGQSLEQYLQSIKLLVDELKNCKGTMSKEKEKDLVISFIMGLSKTYPDQFDRFVEDSVAVDECDTFAKMRVLLMKWDQHATRIQSITAATGATITAVGVKKVDAKSSSGKKIMQKRGEKTPAPPATKPTPNSNNKGKSNEFKKKGPTCQLCLPGSNRDHYPENCPSLTPELRKRAADSRAAYLAARAK